jgi:hypothetical protein
MGYNVPTYQHFYRTPMLSWNGINVMKF